jgi:hypothetical protein
MPHSIFILHRDVAYEHGYVAAVRLSLSEIKKAHADIAKADQRYYQADEWTIEHWHVWSIGGKTIDTFHAVGGPEGGILWYRHALDLETNSMKQTGEPV